MPNAAPFTERNIENRPANVEAVMELLDLLAIVLPYRMHNHKGDLDMPFLDPAASYSKLSPRNSIHF